MARSRKKITSNRNMGKKMKMKNTVTKQAIHRTKIMRKTKKKKRVKKTRMRKKKKMMTR
jgi:hypothetical protein